MSEKLPEGWTDDGGHGWRHSGGASASVHRMENRWRAVVVGVERGRQAGAETDRLNMIAGLEGRPTPDLGAAKKESDTLYARLEASAERHDAVVEKLDALGVPFCGGLVERIEALADRSADKDAVIRLGVELRSVRIERDNLRSNAAFTSSCIDNARALRVERDAALAKAANLEADMKTLTEAREYLERSINELEDRRDADEAHVADLELALSEARLGHDAAEKALSEKTRNFRTSLSAIQRLRVERDNLRHTIATQQTRIDGLTAATCDVAPQLLRDSMRVTQEENARLRAEVSALTTKVITSEAYIARHNEANARAVQERNTCMARMDALRADLATMSEGYARVKGEREACAADVTALRKQLHALRDERDALAKECSSERLGRVFAGVEDENTTLKSEIATLTTRATAAEGYAQHLLAALNAVSGLKGTP